MDTEWYFIAENSLRVITKNFDIDIDNVHFEYNQHYQDYVTAVGGMEHYVIFKNQKALNEYKSFFIDGYMYIDLDKPIMLDNEYIAFLIEFED